jgi:hypothetical protein
LVINTNDYVRDEAMAWINSPRCEAFCYALDIDYRAIRENGAVLYRRFLERAEGRVKAPRKPRKCEGRERISLSRVKPHGGTGKQVYGRFGEGHGLCFSSVAWVRSGTGRIFVSKHRRRLRIHLFIRF